MSDRKLLVIECIPKVDSWEEWIVLREFLKMTNRDYRSMFHAIRRKSKQELKDYLKRKNLDEFDYVHLSGHGERDENERLFCAPKGKLSAREFPKGCFPKKTVTFSSCLLGNKAFVEAFMGQTDAKKVIAPLFEVGPIDAALWFVTFYYHALHRGVGPNAAFGRTMEAVNVKGAFNLWE